MLLSEQPLHKNSKRPQLAPYIISPWSLTEISFLFFSSFLFLPILPVEEIETQCHFGFVMIRWMDLSCQGSDFYRTPNVDRLAVGSLTLMAMPPVLCSPTRAAVQTDDIHTACVLLTGYDLFSAWTTPDKNPTEYVGIKTTVSLPNH